MLAKYKIRVEMLGSAAGGGGSSGKGGNALASCEAVGSEDWGHGRGREDHRGSGRSMLDAALKSRLLDLLGIASRQLEGALLI